MANLRGCREAIDAFERDFVPPACAKTGSACCKCGDTGCEGPAISATGLSSSSGGITTPAAIVVAQVSSSSNGCITTPSSECSTTSATISVVSLSSGTAASALIDFVAHTCASSGEEKRRSSEKGERKRDSEKVEGKRDCLSEQHTQVSAAHTRASSLEPQPCSRRAKKLHAKHVTGGAGALPPPESLLAQKLTTPVLATPPNLPTAALVEAKAVEAFLVSLMDV